MGHSEKPDAQVSISNILHEPLKVAVLVAAFGVASLAFVVGRKNDDRRTLHLLIALACYLFSGIFGWTASITASQQYDNLATAEEAPIGKHALNAYLFASYGFSVLMLIATILTLWLLIKAQITWY